MIQDNSFFIKHLIGSDFSKISELIIKTVYKETGQNNTLVFENVANMLFDYAPDEPYEDKRLLFIMNPKSYFELLSFGIPMGTGKIPYFKSILDQSSNTWVSTLGGVPIIWSIESPTLRDSGGIILLDFKKFMLDKKCVIIFNGYGKGY